jgi:predicted phosphodiesterase
MTPLYRALFLSDSHFPVHNRVMLQGKDAKIIKLMRTGKYQKVIHIGDILDSPDFSRHERGFNYVPTALEGIQLVNEFYANSREALGPEVEFIQVEGNHDQWLERYIARNARDLMNFECLRLTSLLGMDKYNIKFKGFRERLMVDGLKVTHGSRVAPLSGNSARAELKDHFWRSPGISGHTHRQGWVKDADTAWLELGHLLDPNPEISAQYMNDKDPNWNPGFGEGTCCIDSKGKHHWFITPIEIKDNHFVVDGVLY